MSLVFEYTNVTFTNLWSRFPCMTWRFHCSCKPRWLLGRSEGRKGNDVQSLKDSTPPTLRVDEISLWVYCYSLLFLVFKHLIILKNRDDWCTEYSPTTLTPTKDKKGWYLRPSTSIQANTCDWALKIPHLHFHLLFCTLQIIVILLQTNGITKYEEFIFYNHSTRRSQWPRGLSLRSAAVRLLGLRVRIPPEAWMSVCCECCVLSGRGLCDGPITRPEKSYRVWCV
jgi:hypothetical protein